MEIQLSFFYGMYGRQQSEQYNMLNYCHTYLYVLQWHP